MSTAGRDELLIHTLASMLEGLGHVTVGAQSPIPGAAALLARARSGGRLQVSILGSRRHTPFTDGGVELFDCAAQGRIDACFLGGGQIDGQANLNLNGLGDPPGSRVRFPGAFGSAYLYFLVPRVILFREEHSRRVLVPEVDFVTAPGISPPEVHRPGGPHALVTGRAVFAFDRRRARFRLKSVHPGQTVEKVVENTGFAFDRDQNVPETTPPDAGIVALIHGEVGRAIAETYPDFAEQRLGIRQARAVPPMRPPSEGVAASGGRRGDRPGA